jgi:hypothetical protein
MARPRVEQRSWTTSRAIIGAFPDHASRIDAVLISGNAVTVEWKETATNTEAYVGPTGTMPATGKAFEERIVEVIRFEGNRSPPTMSTTTFLAS